MENKKKTRFTKAERVEQVKELRNEGFTLEQMAEVMGVTKGTVQDYLYGLSDIEGVKPDDKHVGMWGMFANDFSWQWPLVCNRVLGREVHEVPAHDKAEERKFWKS